MTTRRDESNRIGRGASPTIHDVARVLGIHKSTVSLALSGKGNVSTATRQRIAAVARDLGYEPNPVAQRLASGHRNALVCLFTGVLDTGLATQKLRLIQKELSATGLEVPIYSCYETVGDLATAQRSQIRQLIRQRPRAIICATQMVAPTVLDELAAYQRAGGVVVSYDTPTDRPWDQVIFDREDNAYRAARYLLERGHRRIGITMSHLSSPLSGTEADPQMWRLRGFRRALGEFSVPVREEWFFRHNTYEMGGAEMAERFMSMTDRPTALCIVNDYAAMGFMVAVMRAGVRVPDDVSLVSHDNQPVTAFCPVPLTSVSQPTTVIGHAVVDALTARVREADESAGVITAPLSPRTVVVQGELIERASVSARE